MSGVSILVGMRAVKELLAGATRIPSASPVRQFVKSGGYEQAVDDFHRIHPSFVHSFEISSDVSYHSVPYVHLRKVPSLFRY